MSERLGVIGWLRKEMVDSHRILGCASKDGEYALDLIGNCTRTEEPSVPPYERKNNLYLCPFYQPEGSEKVKKHLKDVMVTLNPDDSPIDTYVCHEKSCAHHSITAIIKGERVRVIGSLD